MIEGYTPVPVEHFGGLVTSWPAEMLDCDLMTEATNVRFTEAEVSTREGLTLAFATPSGAAVRGLVDYVHLDGTEQPLVFDSAGNLYAETPAGSGTLLGADPASPTTLPAGAWMNGESAFNRAYLAFGNGSQGVGAPASFDGTNLNPVTIAGPTTLSAAADAATAGNIAAGQRYGVVLYRTREGSLTAPSFPFAFVAAGGKQVTVSNLPIGPAHQVNGRVAAFTVAGGSTAGPYFYIGDGQTVNGVTETSTVVGDNIATSATFNFDDDFLAASNDVSDYFRAMLLPAVNGVMFSQTTQRLLWWGDPAQPGAVYCSQPSDAGFYLGDTGFFQVAQGSGLRVTAVFEMRNRLYVALENGLYVVTPNNGDPATWTITQVSPAAGVAGPQAAAVGNGQAVLVHRTGVYVFDGSTPTRISDELLGPAPGKPGVWEQINWAQQGLIWADIDHEQKCVRIGVPMGASAGCSRILKLSYLDGWEPPLRFSAFTARYHYFPGRRWSVDTIAASAGLRMRRPVALGSIPADRRLGQAQILLASADESGAVYFVDAGATTDNGQPFPWALTTGAVSAAERLRQMRQGIEMLGLVQARASGSGRLRVEAMADGHAPVVVLEHALGEQMESLAGLALVQGEACQLRLSGADAEAQTTLRLAALYGFAKPIWTLSAK